MPAPTPHEFSALKRILAELCADRSPRLAVVARFLLAFRLFRDLENRLPVGETRHGDYETLLNGLLFIGGTLENDVANTLDATDLEKVGSSLAIHAATMRYLRERYQLWLGLRDEAAADTFIASLARH